MLDTDSATCVGVTGKKYAIGSQSSANSACAVYKQGAGTLVSGNILCGSSYRKTVDVSTILSMTL